ncbi:uncharacterized protein (TIGR03086 family) [Amycolatopsis bartoniae]|uniref:TIGR03086 family protein n=1 Tax=Amycolatopsis bartoniae TaxID=941986 RepID=A0A8H9IP60_9PSEU|nr:TIGR03086 family metal-binding protein [Amycolatopsis bartoniae]MBB2937779.1 uncharacterized protein (TIGR03086 family) [Amycolatopsis bartoniae]GHF40649.1 TIGR03086 family protein [Amycolatopsis bartoniae]
MPIDELLKQHRVAVETSVRIVSRVGDLTRPTPCAEWTLGDLLAHMIAQHHGFAAAARGRGGEPGVWQVRPIGPAPAGEYEAAAADVLAAFADPSPTFHLPEFAPVSDFPAELAIGFHLIDYVVHGWDVARSLGIEYRLDPALADTALKIALAVPGGDARLAPGAAFAPALSTSDGDPLSRILTALGRSPAWPA